MQKRSRKRRQPSDVNQAAFEMVARSTADTEATELTKAEISRLMTAMGRIGGKKGGKARAAAMTPEERSASASIAARAKWAKERAKKH